MTLLSCKVRPCFGSLFSPLSLLFCNEIKSSFLQACSYICGLSLTFVFDDLRWGFRADTQQGFGKGNEPGPCPTSVQALLIDVSGLGRCQLHPTPGHPLCAKRFLSLLWQVDSVELWVSKITILCPHSFPHLERIPPAAVTSYWLQKPG